MPALFRFRKWDARSFPFPEMEAGFSVSGFSVSGNGVPVLFREEGSHVFGNGGSPNGRSWAQAVCACWRWGTPRCCLPGGTRRPPPRTQTITHGEGHTSLSLLAEMIQNHKEGHAIFSTLCRVHITSTRYCATAQYHNGRSLIIHTYILHCLTESPPPLVYQPSCMHACPGRPGGGHARGSPQRSQTHLYYIYPPQPTPRCRHDLFEAGASFFFLRV